ncbi:MAG: SUMF1/EgtB/PvdO family nonheme iron enzyme [Polyangiaceae bacterium]|nr:SUMF1/EgtB/PvdO family nonheme iron enzyme [Polyangiaceae bacterium]
MSRHPFRKRTLAVLALSFVGVSYLAVGKTKTDGAASGATAPAEDTPAAVAPEPGAVEAPATPAAPKAVEAACPPDMVAVDGMYCTAVKQECIEWIEDPATNQYARCARYKEASTCVGERVHMRFCIDREEYSAKGESLPAGDQSWTDAKKTCEAQGKRLCQEKEWTFACEGEEMRPYPYGMTRDPSLCNFEKDNLIEKKGLRDQRVSRDENPMCLSPFGVHNMVGNIDEWVVLDKPHYSQLNGNRKMMSGLKGGWWGPLRNRCRPTTVDHDEVFHELQTGVRCCADTASTDKRQALAD